MCYEAVDDPLATLNLTPDWFATSKMIKNVLLLCIQMKIYFILIKILVMLYLIIIGIVNIDLNNIGLDDNFDEEDPDTIILIILLAWHIKF